MNNFDNLVNELKDEELLEETVIEDVEVSDEVPVNKNELNEDLQAENYQFETESLLEAGEKDLLNQGDKPSSQKQDKSTLAEENACDYFRKRAVDEVSFLQMVEIVLSGVEREQMKIAPRPYDDLQVKKVLNEYLQVSKENDPSKQAQFEFQLMQETESWYSALTHRDKRISVAHLRRFCETTRPSLSSPALVSLARFYRNSPFSDLIRNKFDLIITRVFSKDVNDQRELVFTREELINHIKGLYSEWESVPLYPTEDDDSEILLMAVKFEEFMAEVEKAEEFDELVENDFFNRLRSFKQSTNENFYSPLIVAAAVECNIKVGNRYVELIELERERTNSKILDEKYGLIIDQVVSDVTSKTLQLVDLLDEKRASQRLTEKKPETKKKKKKPQKLQVGENPVGELFKDFAKYIRSLQISRWVLVSAAITIFATLGLYLFVEYSETVETTAPTSVKKLTFEGSDLDKYLMAPRINNEVCYAVVLQNWEVLSTKEKEDVLKKAVDFGKAKGFSRIHLFNQKGLLVGSADRNNVNVRKNT